jgi:hypothetical protein
MSEHAAIACTLTGGDYGERIRWIADLNTRSLRRYKEAGLTLRLFYETEARADVEQFVRQEQACCGFLTFELDQAEGMLRLTVHAPEEARSVAKIVFRELLGGEAGVPACGCCP